MQTLNGHLIAGSRASALQGMSMTRQIVIPPHQVIYRFYDARRAAAPADGANGAWWLEFEHFQAVKHFAARHGYPFTYAARLFVAILYEWSEVNAFVSCRTTCALSAWKGRGKQVRSTGKDARDLPTMTPMQSVLEVYQLYVPGLGGPASLATQALQVHAHGAL